MKIDEIEKWLEDADFSEPEFIVELKPKILSMIRDYTVLVCG
jgi:hypothetical protein